MMKFKIVPNEKTVTLVISPVHINSVKYLYEKYNDKYFFAVGTIPGANVKTDIGPMISQLAIDLTAVSKEKIKNQPITVEDLFSFKEGDKRPFSKHTDRDGNWVNQEAQVTLMNFADSKQFLFSDLQMQKPIDEKQAWKNVYAVELELSAYLDKNTEEKKVFTIFHRAVKIGEKENTERYEPNNDAWDGYDFSEKKEEKKSNDPFGDVKSNFNITDDDFPF